MRLTGADISANSPTNEGVAGFAGGSASAGGLRLVGGRGAQATPVLPGRITPGGEHGAFSRSSTPLATAAEARAASALSASDARWVFAVAAQQALTPRPGGGAAVVMTPDARERLDRTAARLGLRPFDTALIIAIVQDAARRGEPALGIETADRLALVPRPPERGGVSAQQAIAAAATVLCATGLVAMLVSWLAGGAG